MKLNYLSIALATALATTLTACGSDNSSNYNQSTVAPAKPDAKPDNKPGNDAGTNKPGNDAGTNKPAEDNKKPEDNKTEEGKKPDADAGADKKPEGDANKKPDADAGKKPEGQQPSVAVDESNNVGQASVGGDLDKNATVGTQHYTRGTSSGFDTVNNPHTAPKTQRSTSLATNFVKIKNTELANIVVGRNTAQREEDRISFFIGTPNNNNNDDKALQKFNEKYMDKKLENITNEVKASDTNPVLDSGLVYASASKDPMLRYRSNVSDDSFNAGYINAQGKTTTDNLTDIEGKEDLLKDSRSRILGAHWMPEWETDAEAKNNNRGVNIQPSDRNSRIFNPQNFAATDEQIAKNKKTFYKQNDLTKLKDDPKSAFLQLTKTIDLQHVQYGRVTANLDGLDAKAKKAKDDGNLINGKYVQIPGDNISANTHLSVGNNDLKAVNNYFYRGQNRPGEQVDKDTTIKSLPTSGSATYLGQAIMYGIDNSYHGGTASGGDSNSIVAGTDYDKALGNFVEAKVDFGTGKVNGNVYNAWLNSGDNSKPLSRDNLVSFTGDIKGANSIQGTATLTYTPAANTSKDADFQGSFFGDAGAEMGGSFDSVKKADQTKGNYGVTHWGGVFGAARQDAPRPGDDGFETERP